MSKATGDGFFKDITEEKVDEICKKSFQWNWRKNAEEISRGMTEEVPRVITEKNQIKIQRNFQRPS